MVTYDAAILTTLMTTPVCSVDFPLLIELVLFPGVSLIQARLMLVSSISISYFVLGGMSVDVTTCLS